MSLLSEVMTGGLGALILGGEDWHEFRAPVRVTDGVSGRYQRMRWRIQINVTPIYSVDDKLLGHQLIVALERLIQWRGDMTCAEVERHAEGGPGGPKLPCPYWTVEGTIRYGDEWRFLQELTKPGSARFIDDQGSIYLRLKNKKDKALLSVWLDQMLEQGALAP